MTSKLICPFCGFSLNQVFGDFTCPNNDCDITKFIRGSEECWALLSVLQKKLDRAMGVLNATIETFEETPGYEKLAIRLIKQYKEIEDIKEA